MSIAGNVRAYRRKPVVAEAIQWTGDNTAEVIDFLGAEFKGMNATHTHIWINNPVNALSLYKGAYAVREADGNCYVVSKVIFEALYDLMEKE